jgi:hypothetical protein
MKKIRFQGMRLCRGIAVSAIIVAAAFDNSSSADEPKWHEVAKFKGTAIKSTETFTIPDREWRVSWDTEGNGLFQIYVYDDDGNLKEVIANVIGDSEDSSIIRGAGKYYLKFVGGKYYVTVETKH